VNSLTGDLAIAMVQAALIQLQKDERRINALNVFPVPDGDTASNMILTVRSALEAARAGGDLGQVAEAMAYGALRGARGNSGTIVSQFFYGFALELKGLESAGPLEVARAFASASSAAYAAVHEPKEGTILTVGRRWAEAAMAAAEDGCDLVTVFERALSAAEVALEETPLLLDVLSEAGVVDAGGGGFVVALRGALAVLRGEQPVGAETLANGHSNGAAAPEIRERAGDSHHRDAIELSDIEYAYCTEFLVKGENLSLEALKQALTPLGDSLIVVGNPHIVKVHLHTNRPGRALEIACDMGELSSISISNMKEQNRQHVREKEGQGGLAARNGKAPAGVAVVAVAPGKGFEELFLSQGVSRVVPGGQSMNPSAGELADAIEATGAKHVILLPNNKNIVLTAEQASTLTRVPVTVVPTTSAPQGVAATFDFDPAQSPEAVAEKMRQAMAGVRTVEVTRAARDAKIGTASVREGEVIAVSDGALLASGDAVDHVVVQALERLNPGKGSIVTLYYGEEVSAEEAEAHRAQVAERFPGCEVEAYYGGQPLYLYYIAVE